MPEEKKSPPKQPAKQDANLIGPVKVAESKADKFKRLAEFRVPRAIKAINSVAALSVKSIYESTPEQKAKVVKAIGEAVDAMEAAYKGIGTAAKTFTL